MPPFGYSLWLWFRSNPVAQWVAGIVAGYAVFRLWLWRKIRRERQEAATEAERRVIETIEEKTDDAIKRVEDERRTTADLNDAELRRLAQNSPHNRGRLHRTEAD